MLNSDLVSFSFHQLSIVRHTLRSSLFCVNSTIIINSFEIKGKGKGRESSFYSYQIHWLSWSRFFVFFADETTSDIITNFGYYKWENSQFVFSLAINYFSSSSLSSSFTLKARFFCERNDSEWILVVFDAWCFLSSTFLDWLKIFGYSWNWRSSFEKSNVIKII